MNPADSCMRTHPVTGRHSSSRPAPAVLATLAGVLVALVAGVAALSSCRSTGAPAAGEALRAPQGPLRLQTIEAAGAYVGDQVCANCHPDSAREHAASRHANTVRDAGSPEFAAPFASRQRVRDAEYGFIYSVSAAGGQRRFRVAGGDRPLEAEARFAFGSGKHGWTFLCEHEGTLLENRISYYNHSGVWDLTPGQTKGPVELSPLGRPLADGEASKCFLCHSTVMVGKEGVMDLRASRLNVGCEACHGPGRAHVDAARRNRNLPAGNMRLSAPEVIQLCGRCHRTHAEGARPTVAEAGRVVRFQGIGIAMSRCYTESGGRLSCLTCHNPHRNAEPNPEWYTRVCQGCHAPEKRDSPPCPVEQASGCVGCHMPPQASGFPQNMRFFDHWIRVRPER